MPTSPLLLRTALIACALLGASATACEKKIDSKKASSSIKSVIGKQIEVPIKDVSCPDGIKPEAGGVFICTATFEGGGSLKIKVEQTDAEGTVTFGPASQFFYGDKIAAGLVEDAKTAGRVITADCGDKIQAFDPPGSVLCTVTDAAGKTGKVKVSFAADLTPTIEEVP